MEKILIRTFEPSCCRFVEPVVRSAIRGHENQIEWRRLTLPQDREVLEKWGATTMDSCSSEMTTPVIVMSNQRGEEVRITTINRPNIQKALESFLRSLTMEV